MPWQDRGIDARQKSLGDGAKSSSRRERIRGGVSHPTRQRAILVAEIFESILIVFVNPLKGRDLSLDDWYTNIHIRDVMRIEGGISAQRLIASDDPLKLDGKTGVSDHKRNNIFDG